MDKNSVIDALRAHESELKAAGIRTISLFGSTARSEQTMNSDVDLLATFDENLKLSLLDVIKIEDRISAFLGQRVDLVEERALKPFMRQNVAREVMRAF